MVDKAKLGLDVEDVIGSKRNEILRLAAQHGAFNIRVFGSLARGEATEDSDIDLLVDWNLDRISAWGGVGLDLDLHALLGRTVHILTVQDLHWMMREQVLSEAVPL